MSGSSSKDVEETLRSYLDEVVAALRGALADRLSAIILHGSLAMGSFRMPKSDVDLLVLVEDLTVDEAGLLHAVFERLHRRRPYVGGLEVSVIRADDARSPRHPLPYLVHFSETTTAPQSWSGGRPPTDEDLIAHLTVAKYRGVGLHGPPPSEAIGDLSWADYLASVWGDIAWILEGENILASPYYGILNLCRWAMMAEAADHIVPGKEEAGEWALTHLPGEHGALVAQALAAYRASDWPRTQRERQLSGGPWHREPLIAFRDYMQSTHVA